MTHPCSSQYGVGNLWHTTFNFSIIRRGSHRITVGYVFSHHLVTCTSCLCTRVFKLPSTGILFLGRSLGHFKVLPSTL